MPADGAATGSHRLCAWSRSVLLAASAGLAALFLYGAAQALRAPHALEVGEPFIVSAAWYAGTGKSLYAPVEDLPFLHNNYHPLVQWMAAPILALTGPSFVPMRAISLVAAIGIFALIAALVFRGTGSRSLAWLSAVFPLTCSFVFPWFVLGRVDVAATFLSALSVWAFVTRREKTWLWLLCGWLAFAAKQTAVAGPIAILLHVFLQGERRRALAVGAVYLAGCAAFVGACALATGGQSWLHAVAYNASHEQSALWPSELPPHRLAWTLGPVFLLVLLLLVVPAWKRMPGGPFREWFVIAFVVAAFGVRKSGSHVHYFLETMAAMGVLGGLAASRIRAAPWVEAAFAAALVLGAAPHAHEDLWKRSRFFSELRSRADPVPSEVRKAIADSARPLLLFSKLGSLAIEAGRPAHCDVADFVRLMDLGRFDPGHRLVPLVRAGAFGVIGIPEFAEGDPAARHFDPLRFPGLADALRASYRPLPDRIRDPRWLHSGTVWVPKE